MPEIYGNTTATPMNPDVFSGNGDSGNLDNYYTKDEIDNLVGDIEALLGGI